MRFRMSTLKRSKTIELNNFTYAHARVCPGTTHVVEMASSFFILMRFRQSTLIRYVSMRFRFDPPSRAFSNRCVFDENAQRISVVGKPKRIEMHAFSKRKRSFLDRVLFISLYKRFFFQLVLVANELTLDKLLTAKSKSSSSLSPASSPRGWVCVYFMLFLFLQKI